MTVYSSTTLEELLSQLDRYDLPVEVGTALRSRVDDIQDEAKAFRDLLDISDDPAAELGDLRAKVERLELDVERLEEKRGEAWSDGWDAAVTAAGLELDA